ncbi:Protein of uncharacterised function (DUF1493) [Raoultella terrigena]|uniref:Protein of uncharacterized function (DUF1493) n=1 Tax=Raoultella terrigena TaxID=577 RepID=A0A4U9CYQ4_RAOTE|nr:Protein of uncharacterised function (DUF1493) [Raoultella terrigena]
MKTSMGTKFLCSFILICSMNHADDLSDAIEEYQKEFNIDLSNVDWSHYFPWEYTPLLTRWFKVKREDIEKIANL